LFEKQLDADLFDCRPLGPLAVFFKFASQRGHLGKHLFRSKLFPIHHAECERQRSQHKDVKTNLPRTTLR
jgi:hypothetical protein